MGAHPAVKHSGLESYLQLLENENVPNLILVFGDPFLVKQAQDQLTSFLLRDNEDPFGLVTLDGGTVSMGEIIEQSATFSFFQSPKTILVKNAPLFQASAKPDETIFSPSDMDRFCRFIESGIPENHTLLLTTSQADKRKKLFKTIQKHALMVDCQVSRGSRKKDLDEQRAVLSTVSEQKLSSTGKRIAPDAFSRLVELTGFDLSLFSQNLEKLVVFTGKTQVILKKDVDTVICRDKEDPIFDFTNAFLDKNVPDTLFYLNSLLDKNFHILQLLRALENQVRKLLVMKCCTTELDPGIIPSTKGNFNGFRQRILPKIIAFDKKIKIESDTMTSLFTESKAKKKSEQNDLLLAPNPKNPYPVFILFQRSANFTLGELNHTLCFLGDMDYRLKSSSFDARTVLENHIIRMCT